MKREYFMIYRKLINDGLPADKTITYLLSCCGFTKSLIASMAGVDNAMVTRTIARDRGSRKVENVIEKLLGFNPF